jgi:hypothetical protein
VLESETEVVMTSTVRTPDLSAVVVVLLKGVLYKEDDSTLWNSLLKLRPKVCDYIAVLNLDLFLDEAEGYAFLRSRPDDEDGEKSTAPRLVARRSLSFPVSLILSLLRKKLAEFDASGGDTRLILSRTEIIDLVRVFLPDGSNEVKLVSQIDTHINKIVDLGFLRRLKSQSTKREDTFDVCRILKSFVDAQWLSDFDQRLAQYQSHISGTPTEAANE